MFQWCFNEVSIVFWVCFRVFQGSFNGVSEKFQGWFKDVSGVFQRFLKKIFKVFKKVSCSMALIAAFWAEGGLVFYKNKEAVAEGVPSSCLAYV